MNQTLQFNIAEILSMLGLAQTLYILVYMMFRAGDLRNASLAFAYFSLLAFAFLLDFAHRFIADAIGAYEFLSLACWLSGPPISVLLIAQIARHGQLPPARDFLILLTIPVAAFAGHLIDHGSSDGLTIAGIVAGLISLGCIWARRATFNPLEPQRLQPERYWLILTLIAMNLCLLAVMLFSLSSGESGVDAIILRTVIGMALCYAAGSSLFRIYPQTILRPSPVAADISPAEQANILKLVQLIEQDKVYQEPSYGRSDLARETGLPEATISRLVNAHYGMSLPQVFNERRVAEAKRMLSETSLPVAAIARDVGFNSLATFNRVFREITGHSPSHYRRDPRS